MVTNIISRTDISASWASYSLGSNKGFYLIAVKNASTATDTFDIKNLKSLVLELGIDSGVKNKPITIQRVKLDFSEQTSTDKELNKITAFTKVTQLPNDIYVRVISFRDKDEKDYTEGSMPVGINITPFN